MNTGLRAEREERRGLAGAEGKNGGEANEKSRKRTPEKIAVIFNRAKKNCCIACGEKVTLSSNNNLVRSGNCILLLHNNSECLDKAESDIMKILALHPEIKGQRVSILVALARKVDEYLQRIPKESLAEIAPYLALCKVLSLLLSMKIANNAVRVDVIVRSFLKESIRSDSVTDAYNKKFRILVRAPRI